MSELPQIDPVKVAHKTIQKLESALAESRNSESTLEALAEALRDERDEYKRQLDESTQQQKAVPVQDISSLPAN
jgi:hypothetical protein